MSTRTTVYNKIVKKGIMRQCNQKNISLQREFCDYLKNIDKSEQTIYQYNNDLRIFWVWNITENDNKDFSRITKRDFLRFQGYALSEWKWSPNRMLRVRASISSLSRYVENYLDEEEEYESFKANIKKIEAPIKHCVRDKTIITDTEVSSILERLVSVQRYREACLFALAAYSGARKSELLRFKVSYFDEGNIIPGTSLYQTPEPIKTKGRGSKGKQQVKYTLIDFKPYLDLWMNERKTSNIPENDYIFCNDDGSRMKVGTLAGISETITDYLERPFYFHALRHQLCSRLHRMGLPDNVIQAYFGWESPAMVQRYDDNEQSEILKKYFTVR